MFQFDPMSSQKNSLSRRRVAGDKISKSCLRSLLLVGLFSVIACQSSPPESNSSSIKPTEQSSPVIADSDQTSDSSASNASPSESESPSSINADPTPEEKLESEETTTSSEVTESPEGVASDITQGAFSHIEDLSSKDYISQLQQLGVFPVEGDKFDPYAPITRGEYITWLFKANNTIREKNDHLLLDPTFDPEFTDISEDHPAFKYVQAFANAGFAVGYEDNTFKPDQAITREEMIAIKVGLDTGRNIEPLQGVTLSYSDASDVTPKYTGFIWEDHTQDNIPRAFGNVKQFKPQQPVKRHEAAASIWKIKFDTAKSALSQGT